MYILVCLKMSLNKRYILPGGGGPAWAGGTQSLAYLWTPISSHYQAQQSGSDRIHCILC